VDDLQNVGVCREYNNAPTASTFFGAAPLTGYFYYANGQVLNYAGTMTTDGVAQAVAGPAETYLSNSFATSFGGSRVNASTGHLATSFGTTHPALGSTWWRATPVGVDVTVRPAPGVTINFDAVSAPGDTTVIVVGTGDVPPLPSDGSFLVGVPPALYEISTAATFTPPVSICVPYGGPAPPGYIPTLLHYEGGVWTDIATSYDELFRIVCGEAISFSPFAAGYRPDTPTVTVPGPLQAEATSPSGAVVTFDASAVNGAQGTLPVSCTPASGSTFALGSTLVTCSATNVGYSTTESFTVTVQPATATLTNASASSATIGGSLAVSATVAPAFATGTVTFTFGAQAVSAPVTGGTASATISPVQGGPGLSTLVISYSGDAAVLQATISAQVTVTDSAGPVFGPLTNLVVEATNASGATVIFNLPTAVDGVDGPVAVTCTAASGATFPQGTTPVTCSAADAAGNTTAASFTVTVRPFVEPRDIALRRLLDLLAQYGAPQSLQSVVANLLRHVQAGNTGGACGNANAIAQQLANHARGSRLTPAQVLRLQLTLRVVTTLLGCR